MSLKPVVVEEGNLTNKLNVLMAGVLGANDGLISTAGLVIGIASATPNTITILVTGLAGLVAGALSMAGGEYVSVSTQRDTEKAAIKKEAYELRTDYSGELEELAELYQKKGLSESLSKQVAKELMDKDALAAHAEVELSIDLNHYANPWSAAFSSLCSFSIGALLPLLCIILLPMNVRVVGTFLVVLVFLAAIGYISAYLGNAVKGSAVWRNMTVGLITMIVTYVLGCIVRI